ncbi:hypothetical protein K432DRAFT_383437 [Lepidopterella palustris CBS 459.81]|uniref:Required for respiratory growth protein 7, mitochondrial n=1 Tax=Lepidopterella palustris CBS 459.81 TaxID=1314670 RepID=A0A8E2JDV1_9PEZI|nr:hypothetical protein K432DRAFT_383437 [Lepidopterella palustris CBS 459.81]
MLPLLRRQCQSLPLSIPVLRRSRTTTTKLTVTPGSNHHNDLPSFLTYAERVNLSSTKTVYVGTHYEYTVAIALLRLGFSLIRTGRRADNGIDLIGHWTIPQFPEPLPVIVQCKARNDRLAPKHVREMEGAFQSVPVEWKKKDVLGLLVTTQKATKGVLGVLGMNRWPMGFLKITHAGTVEQFVWNRSAVERGLEGVGVNARYPAKKSEVVVEGVGEMGGQREKEEVVGTALSGRKKRALKESGVTKDIQLTWMGQPIFPDREELDDKTVKLGEDIKGQRCRPRELGVEVMEPKPKRGRPRKDAAVEEKPKAEVSSAKTDSTVEEKPKAKVGCSKKALAVDEKQKPKRGRPKKDSPKEDPAVIYERGLKRKRDQRKADGIAKNKPRPNRSIFNDGKSTLLVEESHTPKDQK